MDPMFETQYRYRADELKREAANARLAKLATEDKSKRPTRNTRAALVAVMTRVLML
jgi:hypothetical protein